MTSSMLPRCSIAAVAFVAVAAVVALAPISSAEAGPGDSPFAGTYAWGSLPVTISDGGRITGFGPGPLGYGGSIRGRVGADGSYSFTMTVTSPTLPDEFHKQGPKWVTQRFEFAGNMANDSEGNIVGTADTGASFAWLQQ